ncbi:MAG: hypothetical protein AAF570_01180 [Bacteroidota bacterium]
MIGCGEELVELEIHICSFWHTFGMENSMDRNELNTLILEAQGIDPEARHTPRNFYTNRRVELDIYPESDASSCFVINFHNQRREWINVLVSDATGQILLQKDKHCQQGMNLCRLDLSSLEQGQYTVRLLLEDGVVEKMIELEA